VLEIGILAAEAFHCEMARPNSSRLVHFRLLRRG
jgi:hypothetical protein